ncbi:hypothetical protein ACWN83_03410 [Pseudolactococcus plantarum]|uniref:YokE-like PH domain-containing protein n=1 Tax=Pseudolactococcus plantarum TaxID=1365 RepID=A0A2A5S0V3_9LACT|nr:hypothetical protein [Lactococcus plantarum]PCS07101.1 hypothetical protein RU87_GL001154 [Lactococcus plantarum]HCN74832.1 hypothetical protein [Lactococcus sp.]
MTDKAQLWTADDMYRFARENKLGFNIWGAWLQRLHFKVVAESLLDDEFAVSSFIGRHTDYDDDEGEEIEGGQPMPKFFNTQGYYAYVITNENRLVYARWRPFFHKVSSIPLNDIKNIEPITHIIWGHVRVESLGDNFSVFWTKSVVRRIAKRIQEGVSDIKNGRLYSNATYNDQETEYMQPNHVPSDRVVEPKIVYDTATMYEKLSSAKLAMEEDLISEAEYNEYKERLLGRK